MLLVMLVSVIVIACAILPLTTCNSIEADFLNSVNRSVSSTEKKDFYFLCIACDGSLAWSKKRGGYNFKSNVRLVRFRQDSSRENVVYLSMLLDKTETCLTSVLLVHRDDISVVECSSDSARENITVFETDSEYPSMSDGNTYLKLVYSGEIVFSGVFNYTYILMCEEQGGQYLSWLIDGRLVKNLTKQNGLGARMLRPHDDDMFSDAFLVTKHSSPESSLASVLIVSVKSRSQSFNVVCRVGGNQEEVNIDLPLQSSPSTAEDPDLDIISDKLIDSSPTTDTTDDITSEFNDHTISIGNSNSTTSEDILAIEVCLGIAAIAIIIIIIILFVLMGVWIRKHRSEAKGGVHVRHLDERESSRYEVGAMQNPVEEESDKDEKDGVRKEKDESSSEVREIFTLRQRSKK